MTIIEWLDSLSDVPGYYLLEKLQREIDGMQQLNERTSVIFINSYQYNVSIPIHHELQSRQTKTIQEKRHVKGWSYRGLKALGWRVWGAILEGVPDHGYKFVERTVEVEPPLYAPSPPMKTFTMERYGFRLDQFSPPVYLTFFYRAEIDTIYALDRKRY